MPAGKPVGFTLTVTVAGVSSEERRTGSQPTPLLVEALAKKLTAPPVLEIETPWLEGPGPPAIWLNESNAGLAMSVAVTAAATVKVTGIVCGLLLAPDAAMPIDPL